MTAGGLGAEPSWTAEFLQSAVVFDDQAYALADSGAVGTLTEPPSAPGRRALSEEARAAVEPETRGRELNDLDTKALTDSFAALGIVCGILAPSAEDVGTESSRFLLAARRADVVVLDWQIENDGGTAAKAIIHDLASNELTKNALKLICIYTADRPNINKIIGEIEADLAMRLGQGATARVSDFELVAGPLHIILNSKVRIDLPDNELAGRYASEGDLPARIVTEFERITAGLLQRVAIRALSALRQSTHSLAARFSHTLDAGYLWHRGALLNPEDAESHVREILTNELEAIIDASDSAAAAAGPACDRVVNAFVEPLNTRFGIAQAVTHGDIRAVLVSTGVLGEISKQIKNKLKKKPVVSIAAFSDTVNNAARANEQFTMMMTLRTPYEDMPRYLRLGTVVRSMEGGKGVYYLCLQPLCDSQRIDGSRGFPLLPVDVAAGDEFNFILPVDANSNGRFLIQYDPYRLVMRTFPVGQTRTVVAERSGSVYQFVDAKTQAYEWLAELRGPIAHRVAQKVANQFGRIGLDMPEWIREKE